MASGLRATPPASSCPRRSWNTTWPWHACWAVRGGSLQLELGTTPDDEAAADRAWTALGLRGDQPVVCLNTGGAFGPAKNWPTASFGLLARRLVEERGVSVVVLCGPAERDSAREIVRLADHPAVVSLADQPLSLGLSKACVRRAALLITTDSGPRHFAAAFRTPVITLFGPTHIAWTRTYHPQAIHLYHPVPCGPCQRPVCPEGHHRCMRDLSPEHVIQAALGLLGPDRRIKAARAPHVGWTMARDLQDCRSRFRPASYLFFRDRRRISNDVNLADHGSDGIRGPASARHAR